MKTEADKLAIVQNLLTENMVKTTRSALRLALAVLSVLLVVTTAKAGDRLDPIPLPTNQSPSAFALHAPADGRDRLAPVALDWQDTTDADKGDVITYYLELADTLGFSPTAFETNQLPNSDYELVDPSGLTSGQRYYWRVKAMDNHNGETWCDQVRSFILHLDSDGDGLWDDFEAAYPGVGPTNDWDHDGLTDEQEQWAGTCPTSPASVFQVEELEPTTNDGLVLRWSSVSNRWYAIDCASNLVAGFDLLTNGIPATPPQNVHTTAVEGVGPFFYRIRLEE